MLPRRFIETIQLLSCFGLVLKIRRFRNARLHPRGEFIRSQSGRERAVARMRFSELTVHRRQQLHVGRPCGRGNAGGCAQVRDGFCGLCAKRDSLMVGRQKTGRPVDGSARGKSSRVRQHHECRQVFVRRAESVTEPGTHAGKTVQRKSTVHLKRRRSVIVTLRKHGVDETKLVRTPCEMRQQTAYPRPALPMLAELINALHQLPRLTKKTEVLPLPFE